MASRRHQRRNACEGKRPHATIGEAITAAGRLMRQHPGEQYNAYHCTHCGKYHAGHLPRKVAEAIAERREGL